ncbi:hypothetical protein [Aliarcobacter butzleri]|uniref:hypothetical protein n=1 Tax=Aliarcobacter butzleri TaxID=28197 RepID=UPI001EDA5744|nr:hypothetical protein [Aliarcobacter butzleri]MCG3691094.1 hypothetical protein [Aliarcobacter butzleri]
MTNDEIEDEINKNISAFKADLLNLKNLNDDYLDHFIIKWIIEGDNFFLKNIHNNRLRARELDLQYTEIKFKYEVSKKLNISHTNVIIMGSSKNGFSLKPDKDNSLNYSFKHFNEDKSDIDLTIIDSNIFDKELESIYKETQHYRKDLINLIFDSKENSYDNFSRYVLRGLIKSDLLPNNYKWPEYINEISRTYVHKFQIDVTIAIFKSWEYFMSYNRKNLQKIQKNIK